MTLPTSQTPPTPTVGRNQRGDVAEEQKELEIGVEILVVQLSITTAPLPHQNHKDVDVLHDLRRLHRPPLLLQRLHHVLEHVLCSTDPLSPTVISA